MSVDPDPASAPGPTPAKSPNDPAVESQDAMRLKRRFKRGGGEPEENENSDQTIQLLSSLLQNLIAKKEQAVAPDVEAAKTSKFHRLSKTGGSGAPEATTLPTAPTTPAAGGTPSSPPVAFRPAPPFDPPELRKRLRRWKTFFVVGVLASAVVTYFAATYLRPAASGHGQSGKPLSTSTAIWNDASLQQIDQALAADQAGDLRGAQRIASGIQKPGTASPPGLDLYLAGLHSRLERTYDAEADLLRMNVNAPPVESALIEERLAFNFSRTRDFEKAADNYREASRLDPFSALLYYRWGEAARHLGHLADALACFRHALDRVQTGQPEKDSLRECINLKMRLCNVEEGQEGFRAELDEKLKAPVPSGYWLLTAAASSLQHKNLPEAAGFLARARETLGTVQFDALLNDYFFRAYADRKEMVDFFPPDPAARRAKLLPTMTYTIEP